MRDAAETISPAELNARLRVFAKVVEATGKNIAILKPKDEWRGYPVQASARERWVR